MYRDFRKEMEQIRLTEEKKEQMWQSLCRETGLDPAVKMVSVHDGQIQGQKKAVRLIGALFRGSSTEAVEQLGDVYKDTEESWVYEGIRYTLNGYWYDRGKRLCDGGDWDRDRGWITVFRLGRSL